MPSANGKKPGPGSPTRPKSQERGLPDEEHAGGEQRQRHDRLAETRRDGARPRRPAHRHLTEGCLSISPTTLPRLPRA